MFIDLQNKPDSGSITHLKITPERAERANRLLCVCVCVCVCYLSHCVM